VWDEAAAALKEGELRVHEGCKIGLAMKVLVKVGRFLG